MANVSHLDIVNGGAIVGSVPVSDESAELLLSAFRSVGGDEVEILSLSGGGAAVVVKSEWKAYRFGDAGQKEVGAVELYYRLLEDRESAAN